MSVAHLFNRIVNKNVNNPPYPAFSHSCRKINLILPLNSCCVTFVLQGGLTMSFITLRVTPEEKELIQSTATLEGMTVSEYIKSVILEKIEDDYDLKIGLAALEKFEKNPVTFSSEEVKKMYDF